MFQFYFDKFKPLSFYNLNLPEETS
ncbi:MAG: hypothetical protein RL481_1179, partial [Pseudomonadota bacterium]